MNTKSWWAAAASIVVLLALILGVSARPHGVTSGVELPSSAGESMADYVVPDSVDALVSQAEAIVVARYIGVENAGVQVMTTPQPTPSPGATPPVYPLPTVVAPVVDTSMVVDQIIRNDGSLAVNDTIALQSYGSVPFGATEAAEDAAARMPLTWPANTEFVLFIRKFDSTKWWIPYGGSGRILTSGDQITCSDSDRTIFAFMEGLNRDEFISAVATSAAQVTPYPTPTPWP